MPDQWRTYVRRRLPPLDIRPEREADIVEELAQQLEAAYTAAIGAGCTDAEARQRAEAEVPDWNQLATDVTRVERGSPSDFHAAPLEQRRTAGVPDDIRRALRALRHQPSYAITTIATIAVALGLGAAAFALIDGILLRPMPYTHAARLVLLKATVPPEGRETVEIAHPDAMDIAARTDIVESLITVLPSSGTTTVTDPPSRIEGFAVSTSFFSTLGVEPALGRFFLPGDETAAAGDVVVIGYALWQRLGSAADIVGRPLIINEESRTIAGVAPPGFSVELFPGSRPDFFVPLTAATNPFANNRGFRGFRAIALLRHGVSIDAADAALAVIGTQLADAYPASNRGRRFRWVPLQDEVVGAVRGQLWLIAALVTVVLLVTTVNHVGLMLARTTSRMRDVLVRVALGASRWRLAREALAEGLVVSVVGALLGALVAQLILDLVRVAPGIELPRLGETTVDGRTLAFLAILATAVTCVTGLVPLLLSGRARATASLRTGHETAAQPELGLRATLIVGQTAFAFVLLASAALLSESLIKVLRQRTGFDTSQVVTMRITVPDTRYPQRASATSFYTELLDQIRAQPGVTAAGIVSTLPLAGSMGSTLSVRGRDDVELALRPTIGWQWASPGYFGAIGIPVLKGRDFADADVTRSPHVTIVNETFARLHFPNEDPIGKQVYFGGYAGASPPEWHEIIGVVGDVRHRSLEEAPDARAYDLLGQHWGRTVSLAVRSAETPIHVVGLVRRLIAERDPKLAVFAIRTTADLVSDAVASRRALVGLVVIFAAVGLVIALAGLYGTLSFIVAQRRREMGVRLALGASASHVGGLVVRRGLTWVVTGVVLGLVFTVAGRGAIEPQLGGLSTMSLPALSSAAAAMIVAAVLACLIPAARAVRVNPVETLRSE